MVNKHISNILYMKRLAVLLSLGVMVLSCVAQNSLDYANRYVGSYAHKVVTPTLKNLKTIVDCSSNQFSTLMKQYNYKQSQMDASDYTHLICDNNSVDFYLNGGDGEGANYIEMSETYKHAQIFGRLSHVFPSDGLVKLRNELNPYYRDRTSDGIERFIVEDGKGGGYLIQIIIQEKTHYRIHIQHFAKLHN